MFPLSPMTMAEVYCWSTTHDLWPLKSWGKMLQQPTAQV